METPRIAGSALLLVLWAISLMAGVILGLVVFLQSCQEESTALQHAFLARQIAESAVAVASRPEVDMSDPELPREDALGGKYRLSIASENGRLNINAVLARGRSDILSRLFAGWGLAPADAATVVESLRRWTQPSPLGGMDRDEARFYGRTLGPGVEPPHRPFLTVEEMANVRGMDAVVAKRPDWREFFTIWTDGKLDLNDAPADLIAAVIGDERVQIPTLIQEREKRRSSPVVEERRWRDVAVPLAMLGVAADSDAAKFFTVNGDVQRIEAAGVVGNRTSRVVAIVRKSPSATELLYHYER